MTLTEFLEARIAEDEADAQLAAQGFSTSEWRLDGGIYAGHESDEVVDWAYQETGQHIARWDPARVLAECAAKRRIIDMERTDRASAPYLNDGITDCGGHPGSYMPHGDYGPGLCRRADETNYVLLRLASVYSAHPDFDPSWTIGGTP